MSTAPAVAPVASPPQGRVETIRRLLPDGAGTTVHLVRYSASWSRARLVVLRRPQPLGAWCTANGVQEALVGGFFTRADGSPLGELRTRGIPRPSQPFHPPWDGLRSCLRIIDGWASIAPRPELPAAPSGDLLQAGPLLVRHGVGAIRPGVDPEGFSAGSAQFDSDITTARYPRAALGIAPGQLFALACDGRAPQEAGLTLQELADLFIELGAQDAINPDGGGSTSLIHGGILRNRPRADFGVPLWGGRPVATALVFEPRGL